MATFLCEEGCGNAGTLPPIGSFHAAAPFFLAPLAGVSDSPFRQICRSFGAALVYSEMVSAKGLYYSGQRTEQLLRYRPSELPIAYQLFGSDPAVIGWAVDQLGGCGHSLIDLNMGCPVPKVVQNGDGSALMKHPALAAEVVRAAVAAEKDHAARTDRTPRPVTVKCRSGWNREPYDLIGFAQRMEEAGASAIAVHGRTREQHYSGKADWQAIARVCEAVTIPVIGSGDVWDAESANRMRVETGCAFVMIARGALGNPWIFQEARALYAGKPQPPAPGLAEKRSLIDRHLALSIEAVGETRAVLEMRKHAGWYLKGLQGAAAARGKINRAVTAAELTAALADITE